MKKRRALYFLLTLSVIAVGGMFMVKDPNGHPLLDWRRLIDQVQMPDISVPDIDFSNLTESNQSEGERIDHNRITVVYRWLEDGVMSYGTEPPAGLTEDQYEALEYDQQANILPALQTNSGTTSNGQQVSEVTNPDSQAQTTDNSIPGLMPILEPAKVQQLFDDAHKVQELLQQRAEQIERSQ